MSIVPTASLPEFFKDRVDEALRQHKLELQDNTTHYIVNLLNAFSRSEELSGNDTLAMLFLEATQEIPPAKRIQLLRRVGDMALYTAGFFSDSLNRKLVDIDYYISMGGTAYQSITSIVRQSSYVDLYSELAKKFYDLVELLSTISEEHRLTNNEDLLRLYEKWLRTGSQRLYTKLMDKGIIPLAPNRDDDKV